MASKRYYSDDNDSQYQKRQESALDKILNIILDPLNFISRLFDGFIKLFAMAAVGIVLYVIFKYFWN